MIRHTLTALFPPHARESGEPPLGPHADHYEAWSGVLNFSRRPRQGSLGDCWLMAPMLAIHALDPEFFANAIKVQPGSPKTLARVFVEGAPAWRSVNMRFPATEGGHFAYATEEGGGPGWPGILEKACAAEFAGSYAWIARGFAKWGFPALSGVRASTRLTLPSPGEVEDLLAKKRPIVASTHMFSPALSRERQSGAIPPMHVMAVVGAKPDTGEIVLRNPWRPGAWITLNTREFRRAFLSVDVLDQPLGRSRKGS